MAIISTAENKLDWNAKGSKRKLQDTRNLMSLSAYDVPFERTMGIKPEVMDQRYEGFELNVDSEARRNLETYMREIQINDINVVADDTGMAQLEVDITI